MQRTTSLTRLIISRLLGLFSSRDRFTEPLPRQARAGSLFVRHLDCGSCNGCELEILALNNPIYDVERVGVHLVASPRHADVLLLTGPFTRNMETAARSTFAAMPLPRRIVTVGDCADASPDKQSRLTYTNSYALARLPDEMRACIAAHAPGCPPAPQQIMETLLDLTPWGIRPTPADLPGSSSRGCVSIWG